MPARWPCPASGLARRWCRSMRASTRRRSPPHARRSASSMPSSTPSLCPQEAGSRSLSMPRNEFPSESDLDAPRLDHNGIAMLKMLEAAMAVLALERNLEPSFLAGLQQWPAFVAASRRLVDELGFGDHPE